MRYEVEIEEYGTALVGFNYNNDCVTIKFTDDSDDEKIPRSYVIEFTAFEAASLIHAIKLAYPPVVDEDVT